MEKIIMSPSKYIQASGAIGKLKDFSASLGKSFFILGTESGMKRTKTAIEKSFKGTDIKLTFELFNRECSKKEIQRLMEQTKKNGCDCIVGIGGGKLLDTAKAVAHYLNLPVIIVPTIASTDAPCSALSVIYTEEGVFEEYLVLPKNPELVLMDTQIIANAPTRFLVAGMGDALATYFEARACHQSFAKNMANLHPAKSAFALARLCYDTLLEDGYKAKLSVDNQVVTPAVENIIEANTYLSGVGFESGGIAAAHAIHNGFTAIHECHDFYHGEKVALGTIAQLVLENSSLEELSEVINFCISVGLPVTLAEIGIKEIKKEEIMKVAQAACGPLETIHNMPFDVTPEMVFAAILTADKLGRQFHEAC